MADVIDFRGNKISSDEDTPKGPRPGDWEFSIYPQMEGGNELDIQKASGFIKFGPMFIAVTEGPEDTSTILFAVATPTVKYLRKSG